MIDNVQYNLQMLPKESTTLGYQSKSLLGNKSIPSTKSVKQHKHNRNEEEFVQENYDVDAEENRAAPVVDETVIIKKFQEGTVWKIDRSCQDHDDIF